MKLKKHDCMEYPPMIQDIINQFIIQFRQFKEIIIWYGDGHYFSFFDEDNDTLTFCDSYLRFENSETGRLIFIPYNEIYEITVKMI